MKTYLIILISFISLTFSFAQERTLGEPIPGADVKVGRKPPGGGQIIATGKTNAKGEFEFKNLAPGTYFVEIAIKEQGIKSATQPVRSDDIILPPTTATTVNPATSQDLHLDLHQRPGHQRNYEQSKRIMAEQYGEVELVVTYQDGMIRGTINVSRSNIKR